MLNWNIVPMTFSNRYPNLLWTEIEWIGKLAYMIDDHENRITDLTNRVTKLETVTTEFEIRITALENYNNDVVKPFFENTLPTLVTIDYLTNNYYTKPVLDEKFNQQLSYISENSKNIESLKNQIKTNTNVMYLNYNVPSPIVTDSINTYTIALKPDFDTVNINIVFSDNYNISVFISTSPGSKTFISNGNNVIISVTTENITIAVPTTITISTIDTVYYTGVVEPTTDEKTKLFNSADINSDGVINAIDASAVNTFYAQSLTETGYPNTPTGYNEWHNKIYGTNAEFPDMNGDGVVNSVDASILQNFYVRTLTGEFENTVDGFWNYMHR